MDATSGSLWDAGVPTSLRSPTTPAVGRIDTDVVVIGAGLTGLWTAYHLARAGLGVVVVERETVGFGASGRNGGWCSALLPMSLTELQRRHGRDAAIAMQRAMIETLDHVRDTLGSEGIDADVAAGGTVDLIRSEAQAARARERLDEARSFGFGPDVLDLVDADAATQRVRATRVTGALVTPHCLAVHPGKLVHGLARAVRTHGVTIHEHSPALDVHERLVRTPDAEVHARFVVRATEAWTSTFPGRRRAIVPLYSMMIATEPLGDVIHEHVGLHDRATFADHRHTIIYGQVTADGRLAFGGRGAPYHFGSRIDPSFDTDRRVRDLLVATMHDLFPSLADVAVTHHWGGPLGVPRDMHASVTFDAGTGHAAAGGYVGDGVATTNLAGRTIADLVLGRNTDLTDLAWVGHRSRRWEPEPVRWLGVNAVRMAASWSDRLEDRRGGGSGPLASVVAAARRH